MPLFQVVNPLSVDLISTISEPSGTPLANILLKSPEKPLKRAQYPLALPSHLYLPGTISFPKIYVPSPNDVSIFGLYDSSIGDQ